METGPQQQQAPSCGASFVARLRRAAGRTGSSVGLGLLAAALAAGIVAALSLYAWEFTEAPANYTRSSASHVDLYNAGAVSHARLVRNAYDHTQNAQPGNPLILVTPAAVRNATSTTVATTATEGFNGTLTDLSWIADHLETTPPLELPTSTPNLTAVYHLNEGAGTTTLEAKRNVTATIRNPAGTTWVTPGKIGASALQFNMSTSSMVADLGSVPLTSTTNWTMEAWVYRNGPAFTNGSIISYVGCKQLGTGGGGDCAGSPGGNGFGMGLTNSTPSYLAIFGPFWSSGGSCLTGCWAGAGSAIPLGQWVHVALTRDGSGYTRAYRNGVLVSTTDFENVNWVAPSSAAYVGNGPDAQWPFNGIIDEVVFHNRVLTEAELLAHVQRRLKGTYTSNVLDAAKTQTTPNPAAGIANPLVQIWRTLSWAETPPGLGEEPAATTAGLQALWKLDDVGGTVTNSAPTAQSGGSLGASTLAGADDPKWLPGKLGTGALWFDGTNDFVTLTDSAVLGPAQTTVEAWVRPETTAAATIYGRRTAADVGGMALVLTAANAPSFQVYAGGSWRVATAGSAVATAGTWSHVAGTYDGTNVKVFLNGAEVGSTAAAAGAINNPGGAQVRLGQNSATGANFFRGLMDGVAVYNSALSAAVLNDHALQGRTNILFKARSSPDGFSWSPWLPSGQLLETTPGLQLLWRFDEGSGRATSADTLGGTNTTAENAQLGLDTLPAGDNSDPTWETVTQKYGNAALRFDGTSDFVTMAAPVTGLQAFTIELWFKATAGTSGTLIGFGGNPLPVSALRDRLLYLTNAGNLAFGVSPSGVKKTIISTATYLDGAWHHVAAVLSPTTGTALYVDGALQGQDATATGAQALSGYWHLGYEDLTGWPSAPTNHRFGGWLDEVAVYDVPLDAGTIAAHVDESFQGLAIDAGSALKPLLPFGRYLQLKGYLSTEDIQITPKLTAVTASAFNFPMRQGAYPSDWPYVSNYIAANPLAPDFTILGPSGFRTTTSGTAPIQYQISRDGTNWYCYAAGTWRLVNPASPGACGTMPYVPLANIQAGFESFAAGIGPGKLYWRAFFLSDGDAEAFLDRIEADYENASFTVTAPALNQTLLTGRTHLITWTHTGALANVTLEYSPKGDFTDTQVLSASTPNDDSFDWVVPLGAAVSSPNSGPGLGASRIRISGADAGSGHIKDDSEAFTLTELDVTVPANETWLLGQTKTITWTSSAPAQNVKIEYAPNGSAYSQTLAGSEANDGSFDWLIPNDTAYVSTPVADPGLGASKIRVSYVSDPAVADESLPLTVTQFEVTAPAAGDLWRLGKSHTVAWTTTATGLTSVTIEYSPSGTFTDLLPVVGSAPSAGGSGSYAWNLPVDLAYLSTAPDAGRIRVSGLNAFTALVGDSPGFTVTRPFVRITNPTDGQVVAVQSVLPISWEQDGQIGDRLKMEYSTNAFADELQTVCFLNCGAPATAIDVFSPYSWVVPDAAASPTVKLRISDLIIPKGFGVSAQFKIAGGLRVAVPVAGQVWAAGKPHNIQWTSVGNITAVKLFINGLEIDPGVAKPNGAGGGTYGWTPAAADASTNAVVRILDAADADVLDDSDPFVLTNLVVTSPAGNERWLAGSTQDITWTSVGVANVAVAYSLDNGGSWTPLGTVAAAGGTLPWTLPLQTASGTVRVRLQDADATQDEARAEALSNPLTIYGQLSLTSPVGGESWGSGQAHDVTWTTPVGTIANVTLEYSKDNFICSTPANCGVIAASTANDGLYSWVPAFTSTTVKVRVKDAQDALTESRSPAFFEITGIAIQLPAGGEVWTVGSTNKTITWTFTGGFTQVNLTYSTDDFATATPIASNVLNTGSYTWALVPDAISSNVKIRITPTTDPGLFSTSNPITIQGVLLATAPNGSEVFDVGSAQAIQWAATGTIPTVRLQLSTNGGSTWTDIETVSGALGGGTSPVANSRAWTVPDTISAQARVRVSDAVPGHPASSDDSNANFTIRAALGVTAPAAGEAWAVNEVHPIQWTTRGTVSQVIFEHSVDGGPFTPFGVANNCAPPDGVTPCLMNWTVPNLVPSPQSDPDVSVVIRVKDATPTHPAASADAPPLIVKWYRIIWHILDSENNNHLAGLNVSDVSAVANWPGWTVTDSSLTSTQAGTLFRYFPAGAFDTAWSKTGYFSGSASGWAADADNKIITVYLESETADQVEFHVHAESAYDPAADTLSFKTWLEKRGLLVGTTAADLSRLGGSTIEIYDGTTLLRTLTDATADTKGQYEFTWPATGLVGGKVYFATASVVFPNQPAPGVTRTSGGVVNVTIPKQIDNIQTSSGGGVTLTELQTELQPITTAVTTTIPDAVTASQTAIQTDLAATQTQLQGDITAAQTAVQGTVTATVGAAQTAIQADVAGVSTQVTNVQTTTDSVKADTGVIRTDTGLIKTDVQTILVPQVNAIKADATAIQGQAAAIQSDTTAIKADTTAIQADTTQIKADTTAIAADTGVLRTESADTNAKVTAILSDPNAGLPKVQQMITDQTTTLQDEFKSVRKGAILNRDEAVELGEQPTITYRSEGGAPDLTVFDAGTGATLLGPVLMAPGNGPGLYTLTLDPSGWGVGEYKVRVNEPASGTSSGTIDTVTLTVREPALRDAAANAGVSQAIADLDTKVTDVLTQLNGLATKADAIQASTDAARSATDQLTADVEALSTAWGSQTLEAVTRQLDALAARVGTPSQAADTQTLVGQLNGLQQIVQSAQGGAASSGYAQNAMTAALEAVDLITQVQQQLQGLSALPGAAPGQLVALQESLQRVTASVNGLPGQVASDDIGKEVSKLVEQVKALASDKGYAFDALYELSANEAADVKTVRNRVEELKALVDVQRSILENRLNEPVVKTWFESAR
jgi:hypothetical protein